MPPKGLEARREHDFHRYLDAVLSISGSAPTYCDLDNPSAVEAHEPVPSPDTALSAFCQLAALRLRTKRALLFFFDVTHAFVLAEATRDLSLGGEEFEHSGDPLWLGFTAIPRGYSVCEQTISILAQPPGTARSLKPVNVISDLREDTRFCGRPYVKGGPYARFYAGVPITSPEGINIGAFCVLDDCERDGLNDLEKEFMRDMSVTIMTHLTLVRAKVEQRRETQMVEALGKFVQDSSGWREPDESEISNGPFDRRVSSVHETASEDVSRETAASVLPLDTQIKTGQLNGLHHASSLPDRNHATVYEANTSRADSPNQVIAESSPSCETTQSHNEIPAGPQSMADDLRNEAIPTSIQRTFERAARQVRDAIGVDGVVFLDASIGTFGGLSETRNVHRSKGWDGSLSKHGSTADDPVLWANGGAITPKTCYVLGSSLSYDMPFDVSETNITEPLLESMLAKYPCGKIWTFEGQGSEYDESTDSANEDPSCRPRNGPDTLGTTRDRWQRRAHAIDIQKLFPRVRSFGFVGMWDHVRQRWFAGVMFWSSSPFRVLSVESDLRYISAFCDVIMTEATRLEAERSDRAKMDFLSSISHELRSPLHGILGSVECLQEQDEPKDVATELLISQIESCGRTLLDIIDHLLEYSRINFSTTPAPGSDAKYLEPNSLETKQPQALPSMGSALGEVALDVITEEVIDAAVFSFWSGRDNSTKDNVFITMDIDCPGSSKWTCRIVTGGWKRICMNIVTNALKYTEHGYIHVGLQTSLVPNSDQLAAVLTVSDTGKGMSKEFLKNHLFRAFSQEDCLAPGIGLGMNLVAKIVQTFGGKIDVQSELDIGTRVTVYLPLEQQTQLPAIARPPVRPKLRRLCSGAVCIVNGHKSHPSSIGLSKDAVDTKAHCLLLETIEKSCSQLSLNVTRSEKSSCRLNILTERDLVLILQKGSKPDANVMLDRTPLIVVCDNSQSERRLRKAKACLVPGQIVEYIPQPCGPVKFKKAIISCLARRSSLQSTATAKGESKEYFNRVTVLHGASKDSHAPEAPSAPISTLPSRSASPSLVGTSSNDGLVLLLVDDNPVNLQLLKTYATKRGFPRLMASNGLEAVQVYKDAHMSGPSSSNPGVPNIVLMDINMPICNGYEATKRIRAYEHEHGLMRSTIIALTGLGSAEAQREAYTSGFDLFLTKPVQLKKLTALLEGLKRDKSKPGH